MAFQFGMNSGTYMLRSAVVSMPIDAKFTTFSQRPLTREQVSGIALRNRPVKAFRQIKSYVNGLISTRIPEELEWVEEHLEEDTYGFDYPSDGECLPIVCPREYTSNPLSDRAGRRDITNSQRSCGNGCEFNIESTSNHNFQQRAHQFRDGFNLATQTWSGSIEFPVRVGPFQPYRIDKSLGNTIVPYVGEATLEYHFRQYQSTDSNNDVYEVQGCGDHLALGGAAAEDMYVDTERTGRVAGRLGDDRRAVQQPRHMDAAKYLFEVGGALAQSARSCGAFGNRGTTEPFCLAVAFNGGEEGSFLIVHEERGLLVQRRQSGRVDEKLREQR